MGSGKQISVDVQNSCFRQNVFSGPLFLVEEDAEVVAVSSNFVDVPLTNNGCTLFAYGMSCTESDLDACPIVEDQSLLTKAQSSCIETPPSSSPTSTVPKSFSNATSNGRLALIVALCASLL